MSRSDSFPQEFMAIPEEHRVLLLMASYPGGGADIEEDGPMCLSSEGWDVAERLVGTDPVAARFFAHVYTGGKPPPAFAEGMTPEGWCKGVGLVLRQARAYAERNN